MGRRHRGALYPRVTELFGADKPFTILLRPDNYIAAIWPGLDVTPAQQAHHQHHHRRVIKLGHSVSETTTCAVVGAWKLPPSPIVSAFIERRTRV